MATGFGVTVTDCVALAELPCASFAVQVIVVVPMGYVALSGCASPRTPVTVPPGQLSVAVAVPRSTVPLHSAFTSAGGVTTGTVLSTTVTFWFADEVLPWPSFAV